MNQWLTGSTKKTDTTLKQCPCHSDRLLNVVHKSAFALRGCDEILEFKMTPFSVRLPGNLPHEALQIHEEVKDGEGIQRA